MRGIVWLCCVAFAMPASAQEGDEDIARTHFEAGNAYYARGDFEDAVREFRRAYELSERPQLLHNIYLAYRDLQDDANAAQYLRQYLAEGEGIENRPLLEERLRQLEAALAGSESETEGENESEGEGEGGREGESEPAAGGNGAGWGVFASGTAILIGGVVAGGLAMRSRNVLDDDWCVDTACREGFEDERDKGERRAMAANVLLSVGAVAMLASIPLFLMGGGDDDDPQASLSCGPGGCMGSFRASF